MSSEGDNLLTSNEAGGARSRRGVCAPRAKAVHDLKTDTVPGEKGTQTLDVVEWNDFPNEMDFTWEPYDDLARGGPPASRGLPPLRLMV
jgi:hypothetical protein